MHNYPQIVTQISDTDNKITTVIDAPWVSVTSINGMTGDVITEANILDFLPNKFYKKNTLISHQGNLYWAKQDFTSGSSFNRNDWNLIEATGVSDWDDIQNKPDFADVAFSGEYTDILNIPSLANVALSGSYTDLSNTPNLSEVALSGQYSDILNTPNLATVATSGRYVDLTGKPTNLVTWTDLTTSTVQPYITSNLIVDGAITNTKLAGEIPQSKLAGGIQYSKLSSSVFTDSNGWNVIPLTSQVTLYLKNGSYQKTWTGNQWTHSVVSQKPVDLDMTKKYVNSVSAKCNDNAINTSGVLHPEGSVRIQEYNCYGGNVTNTVYWSAIIIGTNL